MDKQLHLNTEGIDKSYADQDHLWYEPTPYEVLDRIIETGFVKSDTRLVDFGCGKGRAAFYFHERTGCSVVGVERAEEFYTDALRNAETYIRKDAPVSFVCGEAEEYKITDETAFFMFNPFSPRIFDMVFRNIVQSCRDNPRDVYVILYFVLPPVEALTHKYGMKLMQEIPCGGKEQGRAWRKIQIYKSDQFMKGEQHEPA